MSETVKTVDLDLLDPERCRSWPHGQDACVTCALCSSACPVSGVDGFDPRKIVRLVALGREQEVVDARWPWICTLCGKCEHLCPSGIEIVHLMRRIRSLRPREGVPGTIHSGLAMALKSGNNLGLPDEDFRFIIEDVAEELRQEPGFENFGVALDRTGANLLMTIHNKLINTHTEDLKHWWKIFHAAGEDWTISSAFWEGTNWGYFSGDDEAMRTMTGRLVGELERLRIGHLMWPE
jgi:heterodisulfide reductase subunit C